MNERAQAEDICSDASREDIGALLRVGVSAAAVLVLAGGVMYALHAPSESSSRLHTFTGESNALRSIRGVVTEAFHGDARALIQMGILILIATPVARVVFGAVSFLRARDWIYVAISLTVLSLLLFSIFLD